MKSKIQIEVIANNDYGLSTRVILDERGGYDLLYKLTGNGSVRDLTGRYQGTDYIIRVHYGKKV